MASPFDPRSFLTLAETLAEDESDDTKVRTAINRAYYSVFLMARAKTGATQIEEGSHSAVRRLLKQRGYGDTAERLGRLFELRAEADYDISLDASEKDWGKLWQRAYSLARELENRISGIRAGRLPKNFR